MTRNCIFLSLLLCLPLSASNSLAAGPMPSNVSTGRVLGAITTVGANDPETQLIDIYKDIGSNRIAEAREKADALVAAYPHFRLGHLVRGDLLMMLTHPVNTFGAAPDAPPDKLKDLRAEAMVRIRSYISGKFE